MPVVISDNDQAILGALSRAAEAYAPCPTNPMLMEETGLTESMVKNGLVRLERKGFIELHSIRWSRSIYIPATGKRTDWTHLQVVVPTPKERAKKERVMKAADIRRMKIVEVLQKVADAGEPMPSNFDMAETLVCADETIARDLRALARIGVLVVENPGGGRRRATIIGTGAVTGWAGKTRVVPTVSVVGGRMKEPRADEPDVPEAPEAPSSLLPCARAECKEAAVRGMAYCQAHEEAEMLEWPVVALEPVDEDLAA